jgi:REP element-mobilizing transposase RayT
MQILENQLYHIYNQGNNRDLIFFKRENYSFFLTKFKKYISPTCKVLSYCLMPNHFHFLIYTTIDSIKKKKIGSLEISMLMVGFKQLLSSYAQAINKQEERSGSL